MLLYTYHPFSAPFFSVSVVMDHNILIVVGFACTINDIGHGREQLFYQVETLWGAISERAGEGCYIRWSDTIFT